MQSGRPDPNKHTCLKTTRTDASGIRARVEEALGQLPLAGQDRARIAERLPTLFTSKSATVIGNVEAVAARFRPHGLTLKRYLAAALEQPQLFYQSPATLIANVETVAGHFAAHGLTLKEYLRAAVQRPS